MQWPEWVWVELTERSFCKYRNSGERETHDLLGWCRLFFRDVRFRRVKEMFKKNIEKLFNKRIDSVSIWIDSDYTSLKDQAVIWNKTMEDLGYTESYKE